MGLLYEVEYIRLIIYLHLYFIFTIYEINALVNKYTDSVSTGSTITDASMCPSGWRITT